MSWDEVKMKGSVARWKSGFGSGGIRYWCSNQSMDNML